MPGKHRLSVGFFKKAGSKGGKVRARRMTKAQRVAQSRRAARIRWAA